MQVRTDFRDRLPEALKEINTHLLEAEFGQFGKEMPTLLIFMELLMEERESAL